MRTIVPFFLALTACGSTEGFSTAGQVSLCLGADAEVDGTVNDYQDHTWPISGTAVADAPADGSGYDVACNSGFAEPSRTLTVLDGDGVTWSIGYGIDVDGDRTPTLAVQPGDAIEVTFIRGATWGTDHAVVIRDEAGAMLFAAQEGMQADLEHFAGAPLGNLSVEKGEAYGPTRQSECGRTRQHEILFEGDTSVAVEVGETGTVQVDGAPLTALNAGAWSFVEVQCTDVWGPTPYAVWKE